MLIKVPKQADYQRVLGKLKSKLSMNLKCGACNSCSGGGGGTSTCK